MGVRQTLGHLLKRLGEVLLTTASQVTLDSEARVRQRLDLLEAKLDRQLVLTHRLLQTVSPRQEVADSGYRVFSQFGEDGILGSIVNRVPDVIPSYVEFGVEDFEEANTRLLAEQGGWRGLLIDSDNDNIERIKQKRIYWSNDLVAIQAFVTAENINEILTSNGFVGEIGVMSIDIDGNDFWVWKAIKAAEAQIIICEYNSLFGRNEAITIPYQARFTRREYHHSQLYFGSSLPALAYLATTKGYDLVAVEPTGVNAFFVRSDLEHDLPVLDASEAFRLTPVRESLAPDGSMTFLGGRDRLDAIAHLPVERVPSGEVWALGDLNIQY